MECSKISDQVSIKHCSLCPGTTEYYCRDCKRDLCRPCKETHVDILDIEYHCVTIYKKKCNFDSIYKQWNEDQVKEMMLVEMLSEVFNHPLLVQKYRQKQLLNSKRAYEHKCTMIKISCETIYNTQVLLAKLMSDYTTCHKEISQLQTTVETFSLRLKDAMDNAQCEISSKYKALWICRLQKQQKKQKKKIKRNIARIQKYEHRYEKSANRPVQFLRFIKTVRLPQMQDTHHCLFSLTQEINMKYLIEILSDIKITQRGKRDLKAGHTLPLTLMSSPVLLKSLSMTDLNNPIHISCVTPDRVWIRHNRDLILTDITTGVKLHSFDDHSYRHSGSHSVNKKGELIYLDKNGNIVKLSKDMKTTITLTENLDTTWEPLCVYSSPSSGDLLVGKRYYVWSPEGGRLFDTKAIGKVMRYDSNGQHKQTIPEKINTTQTLYQMPKFVTENNNGDVVVSDFERGAVTVTSHEGIHRFSYKGPPLGSKLLPIFPQYFPDKDIVPFGICTDALSNILVCDLLTRTVQMLSQDGQFLKYLLRNQIHWRIPYDLSYDVLTDCLWVIFEFGVKSELFVYRHINRHPSILH